MKYLKISLLVFVLSLSANILAQMQQEVQPVQTMTYTIKGLVVDTAGKAIAYPTVSIKRDSTSFDYSERYSGDADGRFEFNYTSSNDTIFINIAAATKTSVTRRVILATETVIDLGRVALRNGEELAGDFPARHGLPHSRVLREGGEGGDGAFEARQSHHPGCAHEGEQLHMKPSTEIG